MGGVSEAAILVLIGWSRSEVRVGDLFEIELLVSDEAEGDGEKDDEDELDHDGEELLNFKVCV